MIEERGHDHRPAMAEDPHPPPASALLSGRTGRGEKRRGREGRFSLTSDGEQPPHGDGDDPPKPFRPGGIDYPGRLPLPLAPFDFPDVPD